MTQELIKTLDPVLENHQIRTDSIISDRVSYILNEIINQSPNFNPHEDFIRHPIFYSDVIRYFTLSHQITTDN